MPYRLHPDSDPPDVKSEGESDAPSRSRRAARRTVAVVPTMLTLGNLLSGFGAIFFASRASTTEATLAMGWTPLGFSAVLIFFGMVLDALDGRVARLTGSTSDMGEQLDSMADMVTFGVAPAFLVVQLIGVDTPFVSVRSDRLFDRVVVVIACIYVACAALRLARFNIELNKSGESDHHNFKGLPTPGAAGTVASLVMLHQHFSAGTVVAHHWTVQLVAFGMVAIMLLTAFAMVSRLRYTHVANRYIRGQERFGNIAKLVVVSLFVLIHPQGALATGFVIYALSAPTSWASKRIWRARSPQPPATVSKDKLEHRHAASRD